MINTVLIEGAPELRKSVLLRHTAYKWAQGELLIQNHFVFLLMLRDSTVRKMASLSDLLTLRVPKKLMFRTDLISKEQGKNVTF